MNDISPASDVQDQPTLRHYQKWHINGDDTTERVAVSNKLTIGKNVTLRTNAAPITFVPGDCYGTIKDGATVCSGVTITTNTTIGVDAWIHRDVMLKMGCEISAEVVIEKNATIGEGARIGKGARIGEGAIIGDGVIVSPGVRVPDDWLIPGSDKCTVVVNSGRTEGASPVVLIVPR